MFDRIVYACSGSAPDEVVLDLSTFKSADEPLSPLFSSVIPMDGNFHRDVFIEGFIQNLMHRKALISVGVWRKVIRNFFSHPFLLVINIVFKIRA